MHGHFVYYSGFLFDVMLTAAHAQNIEGWIWNYWMVTDLIVLYSVAALSLLQQSVY